MSNVFTVFIVKSFGPEDGYTNLKAFVDEDEALAYQAKIAKQIPEDVKMNSLKLNRWIAYHMAQPISQSI